MPTRFPKVSVIIPALNEEKYIEATLQSLHAQDYKGKFEIILADGHSSDHTVAISKKYVNKTVRETTRTIAAGRQAGARVSSGDLLLYTDADSIIDRSWVSQMVRAFDNPRVMAAFGLTEPREGHFIEIFLLRYAVLIAAWLLNHINVDYVTGSNMAMRRSAFERIGGFNIYLATSEDTDLIHRIRSQGDVVFVPGAVTRYSIRRIRSWGYRKYLWFHTKNFFQTVLFKHPARHYEVVR